MLWKLQINRFSNYYIIQKNLSLILKMFWKKQVEVI